MAADRDGASASRGFLPRPTIRLRLTLVYGAIFLASGALLLAVTYLLVSAATGGVFVYRAGNGEFSVSFTGVAGNIDKGLPPGAILGPGAAGPQLPDPAQLQALAQEQHAAELNQLLFWSVVALAIMAVASIGIGWLVAGRVLAPLRTLTADVRQISATNLHRHLALDGPDDELKDLGTTFNDLLSRLGRSFEAQRQFVANASHELRTPLARQRTVLQVALADPNATLDSLRAAGERALVAGDQQERLIEALFMLARGERGLERREKVDLAAVASEVVAGRRADAERAGLTITTRLAPAPTSGDARLLDRLIANLVDNAVRYNEPGGSIDVATGERDGSVRVAVANTGRDVPAAEIPRLLEPFQRLDGDRTGHGDGWGLGLSIVRAITAAHGGALHVRPRTGGGLEVEVTMPRPRAAVDAPSGRPPAPSGGDRSTPGR